jgi:DNA-binding CsgD family transcriptional regulator
MTNHPQGQKPSTEPEDGPTARELAEYAKMIGQLYGIGQRLCGQTQGVAARFCWEVALVTHERAQLRLHFHRSSSTTLLTPQAAVEFPVQFGERNYGTLSILTGQALPGAPALPLPLAHLLAQICGWLLYTFELAACLPGPARQTDTTLTRREKEVLLLMCKGYSQVAIARALSITLATVSKHRQRIYAHFGVHNERDASLAAFQAGLFFPLEEFPGS